MENLLKNLHQSAIQAISATQNAEQLKEVEVKYLGRKGELTEILKGIKDLSAEEKPILGLAIQKVKTTLETEFQIKFRFFEDKSIADQLATEFFDITVPGVKPEKGTIHPLTQTQNEIETIFSEMGFSIMDGPEVESEYYNFEALNVPSHHPARDMQDTFFLDNAQDPKHGHLLLRTHTSPAQIRAMEKYGAPLKIIVPGRVFRYEATDATHDSTFYQVEGMLIDKNISLASFQGIMTEFLTRFYGKEITLRFRPGYFPFVEPGVEIDILWKKGQNGEPDKWLESMGAGMIHPNVLKAGGLDPETHQGWAFGMGLTRLAMIKYALDDIRLLHENDLRFLRQF